MDGNASERFRYYPRNNSTIQPRPEWRRRTRKSNDHGESQGDYCRIQTRQKTLDGNRRSSRLSQESQSNKCSRDDTLRALARNEAQPLSSQNHRINSICSCSKRKTHQTRHSLAQGHYDRVWRRYKPVQGMGSYKGGYCSVKGCGIHRGKAHRSNSSNLHRRTQDYLRLDHSPPRTASKNKRATTIGFSNASSVGTPRLRLRLRLRRSSRPSDPPTRNPGQRTARWSGKRANTEGFSKVKQGHIHHQEIRRRKLRQRTTSSHGKDRTQCQSRRRRRASNSSGSYQPSDARQTVGESHSRRNRLSYQESHLGSRSSTSESPSCQQQIRVQAQKERNRTDCQVESKARSKRIQSDLRRRLPRYLCTGRQTRIDKDSPRVGSGLRFGYSSDGRCDGILGRGIGGGNLHGATRGIQSWNNGRRSRLSTQEKSLRPQASPTGLESENSGLPQVNRLRSNLLGPLRVCQQGNGNHRRNVGGRPHHFWQGYGQHQFSQGTAKRRVRDEGPRRTQVFPRHPSPARQKTENPPHQPTRIHSNDPQSLRHARQQTGKHSSPYGRPTRQSSNHGHLDRSEGLSKYCRKYHVWNARNQARSRTMYPANLPVFADPIKDPRKGGKARASVSQWNGGRRNHLQR